MTIPRNLVVGLDGTWNDTTVVDETTNVVRLLDALFRRHHIQHYEEGVGTAHWEALPGGIYGEGLDRQILGGYRFLRKRFADTDWQPEKNKVFIFGFSRGSYAARRLAGMIDYCGLPRSEADVNLAWNLYLQQDQASIAELKVQGRLFPITIEMLGVWDTVKATNDRDFHDTKLPACVSHGYHAISIDEKRKFFPILRWNSDQRVRQLWFAGVHSDVGGGYTEKGLSDITLRWMVDRAYDHGLRFLAREMCKLKDNPEGQIHDSYDGIWKVFGTNKRSISATALVHNSVKLRMQGSTSYGPTNLPTQPNYVNA
jgi:uncharacterized protein (DUF2235 family)